jgi:hypothetical protein
MTEAWMEIKEFEGFYEVSNTGLIRSLPRQVVYVRNGVEATTFRRGKVLTPKRVGGVNGDFYSFVTLCKDGVKDQRSVHRLVARHFIGESPFDGAVVMHLDDDTKNNQVGNLRWGTDKENAQDKVSKCRQPRGNSHARSRLKESDIPIIRELKRNGVMNKDVAKRFGVGETTISNINSGRTWSHIP